MKRLLPLLLIFIALPSAAGELKTANTPAEITRAYSPGATLRVVNIWATWCIPCVAEMNDLRDVDAAFDDREVAFVGVSLDDMIPGPRAETLKRVRDFLQKKGIRYTNVYYEGNLNRLAEHFRFNGEIPITLIYDSSGRELSRHEGVIQRDKLTQELRRLLAEKSARKSRRTSR